MFSRNLWRAALAFILMLGLASVKPESVSALGTPQIVSINAGSPAAVGTNVSIRATVQWDSDFRSMRICFRDTNWCQEDATPDITKNFDTSGLSAGSYQIIAQVAKVGEGWDTATQTQASYELTDNSQQNNNPPQPSSPSISCRADAFDAYPRTVTVGDTMHISGSGSCNVGVRATKVQVDGGNLYEIGSPSLEWDWNTSGMPAGQHKLKLWVAGQGDHNWSSAATSSNIFIQLNAPGQSAPSDTSSHFRNSDVIDIKGDLYVISVDNNGNVERHHIPNPETLDALGIPRSWVDNKGWSNSDLKSIHAGSDVPDANRDPSGFAAFKAQYFPNTTPITPGGLDNPNSDIPFVPNGPAGLVGDCPAAPAALAVGGNAVIAGKDLNLRSKPGVNNDPIAIVPNFSTVAVIDGPKCKDEVRWFKIRYHGAEGWAAEVGTGGEYHIYPGVQAQNSQQPVQPAPPATQPAEATQVQPNQPENLQPSGTAWYCYIPFIGLYACPNEALAADANTTCKDQCVVTAEKYRGDIPNWSTPSSPNKILADAKKQKQYPVNGQLMQVRLRNPDEAPQNGDLFVMDGSCKGTDTNNGHIGY